MKIEFTPSTARGTVTAPPSKSMAHRYLICAGLCEGKSKITGVTPSQDLLATMDCLTAIGVTSHYDGDTVEIHGVDPEKICISSPLPCRESGSTLRFFLPIVALSGERAELTGSARLLARPMDVYEEICRDKHLRFHNDGERITVEGKLTGGILSVRGDVSSQFISGLLFVLPLLGGDSEIHVVGTLESRPYVDMTISALASFGVTVEWKSDRVIAIRGGQRYRPCEINVEGDYSNAAFLDAFNYLGGEVKVEGLSPESLQGDRIYAEYFARLNEGCATLELSDCPDLAPVLFALASVLHGGRFTGTARLRFKESDRASAMAEELAKLSCHVELGADEVRVEKGSLHAPTEPLNSHNDHRIAMALSLLLSRTGGAIDGAEAVCKSMPHFFELLKMLGIGFSQEKTRGLPS